VIARMVARLSLLLAAALCLAASACTPGLALAQQVRRDPGMPIRHLSPGSILTTRRALICAPGYAARTRSVSSKRKDSVFVRYRVPDSLRRGFVIDHVVPIEGGGSNLITNLFAQDTASARKKDRAEAWMKHRICVEQAPVRPLQRAIAKDWRAVLATVPKGYRP
jgi:hypothetical protein